MGKQTITREPSIKDCLGKPGRMGTEEGPGVDTAFLKWFVAAVDTPFIYLATRLSRTVLAQESSITLVEKE